VLTGVDLYELLNFVVSREKGVTMSILFHDVIFGPVQSRRLGVSLGVNLLPIDRKFCTFNCIYCECGWTHENIAGQKGLPGRDFVAEKLEEKLKEMASRDHAPDAITFAGNGEPTIHPQFPEIMEDVIRLRDRYFPEARVTVLTNSSTLHKPAIFNALKKAGNSILKLDAGTEEMFQLINAPQSGITLKSIVEKLKEFDGELIIQSLFLRGQVDGRAVDNTKEPEFSHWLKLIKEIGPKYVMIYPIDRATPNNTLEKVSFDELKEIAGKVEAAGIKAQVFY
jgi:wyosine [tRNA(Phe)-imidazoG37] synthetase (radical SAM superfamily)